MWRAMPESMEGIGELYEQSLQVARQRGEWFLSDAATPLVEDEGWFINRATREVLVTDHEFMIG